MKEKSGNTLSGTLLAEQNSPSKNFGDPPHKTGTFRKIKIPKERHQISVRRSATRRQKRRPPGRSDGTDKPDRAGTTRKICQQLWNHLWKHWASKRPSRMERSPQKFFRIGHGWEASASKYRRCWNTPCKTKKPNGQMPDAPQGGCKLYGRRIRLVNQPWEGPH